MIMRIFKASALALAIGLALGVNGASAHTWPVKWHKHVWAGCVFSPVGDLLAAIFHHPKKAW